MNIQCEWCGRYHTKIVHSGSHYVNTACSDKCLIKLIEVAKERGDL